VINMGIVMMMMMTMTMMMIMKMRVAYKQCSNSAIKVQRNRGSVPKCFAAAAYDRKNSRTAHTCAPYPTTENFIRVLQEFYKGDRGVLQEGYKSVLVSHDLPMRARMLQECYRSVTRELQECFSVT
jgi:hypothetical protein